MEWSVTQSQPMPRRIQAPTAKPRQSIIGPSKQAPARTSCFLERKRRPLACASRVPMVLRPEMCGRITTSCSLCTFWFFSLHVVMVRWCGGSASCVCAPMHSAQHLAQIQQARRTRPQPSFMHTAPPSAPPTTILLTGRSSPAPPGPPPPSRPSPAAARACAAPG